MEGEEELGMTRIRMSTLNLSSGNQCEWRLILLLPLWPAPHLSYSAAGSGRLSGLCFSTSSPCPAP